LKKFELDTKIIHCKQCPRLSSYISQVAKNKVKRFREQKYWGKPLTGFGDIKAELKILKDVKVIVCHGKMAFSSFCKILGIQGMEFSHNKSFRYKKWVIICSYHPSRQNTQTGRLSWHQWNQVFTKAKTTHITKIIVSKIYEANLRILY